MDKTTLVLIMAGLLVLFIVLVAVYVIMGRSKKTVSVSRETAITFEMLCAVIKHASTQNPELNRAVDTIIERYCNVIEGERPFEVYASLLAKLCVHPHTDSKMILRFQRSVLAVNPTYKEQIEKTLKLGLAGRDKK
jgi:uncharacterized protein YpmS